MTLNHDMTDKFRRQEALLKTSELLNSIQDTSYVLNALLNESLKYIEGADAGIIFLFNEDTGYLEVRSYIGYDQEVEKVKLKPSESITGLCFSNRKPMFFKNPEEVHSATSTMRLENRQVVKKTYENLFPKIRSAMACPLIFREKCIGVIVVDNYEQDIPLDQDDLDFLKSISVQAAIAVNNAMNYEKEIQNNLHLQKYNRIIEKQRNEYEYSTNLHNKLTSMVLEGSSLQDIIQELAKSIDRDVILIDVFFNIRDYVMERSFPFNNLKRNRAAISQKLSTLEPTIYKVPNTLFSLFLFPIIVSKNNLGWLGIISEKPLSSELDKITVERGITILALELLKTNEMQIMEQKLKGDFLDNLILNQDSAYIDRYAQHYGFNRDKEHQLMIIELEGLSPQENESTVYDLEYISYQRRFYEFISKSVLNYFPNTISIIKGYTIVFILELNKVTRTNLTSVIIERILNSNQVKSILKGRRILSVGVSNSFSDLNLFKNTYNNALQALKISKNLQQKSFVVFYDELQIKRLLLNNPSDVLLDFVHSTLGNLLNYTNNSRQEFYQTLSTYIKNNGNWSYTKDKLHIHGNTLSYRLKRIEEILGLDLDNYYHRLRIQIALEILEINSILSFLP